VTEYRHKIFTSCHLERIEQKSCGRVRGLRRGTGRVQPEKANRSTCRWPTGPRRPPPS